MSIVDIASPLGQGPTTLVAPPDLEVIEIDGPYQRVVDNTTGQHSLQALQSFKAGEVLATFGPGTRHAMPNMYTVMVSEHDHVELVPKILQFANHSCAPNTFFNTSTGEVEVLADIRVGDMITWFYPCSELRMACPFQCTCRSNACLGMISGAADIPKATLARYKLNTHIIDLLKK